MITAHDIQKTIDSRGREQEHLMLILRDLENLSGVNRLSTDVLTQVADRMNLPRSTVAGFLSFYSMFGTAPRGRFIVRVCKSGPCHVMGTRTIFDAIGKHLGIGVGEVTPDGTFSLEATACLGVCSVAPAMMVNYDLHGNLTEDRIKTILEGYRSKTPIFGEASGPEIDATRCVIEDGRQTKRLLEKIGVIDPLDIRSYIQQGGYSALKKALSGLTPADVIARVKDSGLRGRGGAGFPAGLKWSFVTKGAMQKYVICNADEGEPGTFKDRILLDGNPHQILEGIALCGYAIGASIGYIYVRGEYRRSIERLQKAIDQARGKGFLGSRILGSTFDFDIIIKEGGGSYECGEESALINSMEGKRGFPRFRPPFPAGAGFKGQPSNVNNVETYASVPLILAHDAEWYRSVGPAECPGTKLYCLSGKLNRTGLVELPMGATLRELIETYGRGIKNGKTFKFAQVGGSAGGILGPDLLDLPLDIDQTIKAGVTLGSGAVLACDQDTCPVDFLLNIMSFFEHESCGQCVPCRVGTRQIHYLAQKFAARRAEEKDMDRMLEKATLMKQSLCALGQSPILPVRSILNYFREDFIKHCDPRYHCPECDKTLATFYPSAISADNH
jgi:NADH:ubiquinone oxidoreductase subunit F (NADH-binding)/NADH:ubiquinone oxidoreductase subunit E